MRYQRHITLVHLLATYSRDLMLQVLLASALLALLCISYLINTWTLDELWTLRVKRYMENDKVR